MSNVHNMNLSDDDSGMVPLNSQSKSNAFVPEYPEKNVSDYKEDMDSTPISDVMMQPQEQSFEPPLMAVDPRAMQMAQQQVMAPSQQGVVAKEPEKTDKKGKNPFDLSDEQFHALIVAVATGGAVSKPVQEKLASSVPQFLNAQGQRSLVGLGSTGLVAAIIFFIARRYF